MKVPKFILLPLLLLCLGYTGHTQTGLMQSEIGLNAGGLNYIGDLNNQSMFGRLNLGYGLFYRYNFDDRWCLRFDAAYGHLEGGNPKHLPGVKGDYIALRNLSFYSYVGEASVRVEFNFFNYGASGTQYHWTPYLFVGLGMFAFNPTACYTDPKLNTTQWYDLQPLGTEGQGSDEYPDRQAYSLMQANMPFGLGFKFKPNALLAFSVEYGFRKTWTDYIDDVSTTYVGSEILDHYHPDEPASGLADRSGEVEDLYVNAPGIKRGDDSLDDWYAYLNVSVSFRLDKLLWWVGKKKCEK